MFSWNQLHRGVKAIFFVQIVNRMGDFVVPFLTLILTQVQGFSPAVAGLVVTLATGLGSLGGLVAGKLSDQHSRRDVLIAFLGTSGLLLAAAGFAPAHLVSAVAMVVSGFFFGAMRPVMGALVGDLSSPENRRAAFSLSYFGVNIGVAVGPLLAGWLFGHALNWLFWLDAMSTLVAILVLLSSVPRRTHGILTQQTSRDSLSAFLRHPILPVFGVIFLAYHFVYSQMVFSLSLQLVALFGSVGPSTFGLVWGVNALIVVAFTPLALRLTKNHTNLASMSVGMILFGFGTSVFLFHPDFVWVLISTVLWSTGEVLFAIHMGDLVTTQSPAEHRGRFQGYVQFLGSLGFVVSPVISGAVADFLGLAGVWWIATVLILAVAAGFAVLGRRLRTSILPG